MGKDTVFKAQIHQIVTDILNEDIPVKLLQLTQKLFDTLLEFVSPIVSIDPDQKDLILQNGKALSPYSAASSIKELYRTRSFMSGALLAVKDLRDRHSGECLHIVYAGTGPFAILALPVMFAYTASEVKFTFIDIHSDATRALTYILGKLGFTDHIEDIVCVDATKYSIPANRPTHLVISETMQRALVKETQVGITLHLAPQVGPDTIWIPESIHIEAALVNKSKDMERMMGTLKEGETHIHYLGTLMNLTKEFAQHSVQDNNDTLNNFEEVTFTLPQDILMDYPVFTLMTTINVYGPHYLLPHESSITLPHEVQDLSKTESTPKSISLLYRLDDNPRFEFRLDSSQC